ncbi:MAG: ROK family protein, partial [Lentisphaeria bacterium]
MMSSESFKVLGIDIGGTKIAVCITDSAGEVLASGRLAMAPYAEVLPEIVGLAKKLAAGLNLDWSQIRGCGICAPGPLDMAGGRIMKSPNMTWDAVPIREDLQAALQMPAAMDNDANA